MAAAGPKQEVRSTDRRLVLSGVQKVGFYSGGDQCPEDVPFPSCLASALRYIGEEYAWTEIVEKGKMWRRNDAYLELMAASGMAFGFRWKEGWYQDNSDMMFVADPGEIISRAFAYAGYSFHPVDKQGDSTDRDRFLAEIKNSLKAGKPLLAFGVVGPPECSLVTGYDDAGDILIGWSFFQAIPPFESGLEHEPEGYFRKSDWFADTWSLMVIGEKRARPDLHVRNLDILKWGLAVGRSSKVFGQRTGLWAYDAWAKQVANEADFLTDDERVLVSRHEVHNAAVGVIAEGRWAASEVLKTMASSESDIADSLIAVSELFRQEHDIMWHIWDLVGGNGSPSAYKEFASSEVRRRISDLIIEARDLDAKALDIIEHALGKPGR